MVHPYLKRRQGREAPDSLHPSLDPVLARTLGVPLFQEQLLRMAMIAAGFTGGEAEELRRAFGFKRSEARMKDIEKKLRAGMNKQGIAPAIQDKIVLSITSFALYGFPESHAASFALIAYASAYLKCHYLPAFTAAILNNQPMGFYNPATLVKDAQRHGLKVKPIDIAASNWKCTLEHIEAAEPQRNFDPSLTSPISNVTPQLEPGVIPNGVRDLHLPLVHRSAGQDCGRAETPQRSQQEESFGRHSERSEERFSIARLSSDESLFIDTQEVSESENSASRGFAVRLGLNFVKGLRAEIASEIIREHATRPFASIDDLKFRIPAIQKSELTALAEIGALNSISGRRGHRRSALWQVERAARPMGPLLESPAYTHRIPEPASSPCHPERSEGSALAFAPSPLFPMTPEERLLADFRGTGLTVGLHPMAHHRATLERQGVRSAIELRALPDGTPVRIAGSVIARQRPGTAKGFVFLSIEDETGIANAIITPQLFTRNRVVVVNQQFLLIDGVLQNQDNVISVKAHRIQPLTLTRAAAPSHDFH
jgi:error-prone DNA polymerase